MPTAGSAGQPARLDFVPVDASAETEPHVAVELMSERPERQDRRLTFVIVLEVETHQIMADVFLLVHQVHGDRSQPAAQHLLSVQVEFEVIAQLHTDRRVALERPPHSDARVEHAPLQFLETFLDVFRRQYADTGVGIAHDAEEVTIVIGGQLTDIIR